MSDEQRKILGWSALALICVLLLVPAAGFVPAWAQEKATANWRYSWEAPTAGSPPAYYVAEIRRDGTEIMPIDRIGLPTLNIPVDYGHDYEIRVRAVDAFGRKGPFSGWSERTTCELVTPRL